MITKKDYDTLNKVINKYIQAFSKKQEMELEYWIADVIGDIACFNSDYFFSFTDIRLDLETNQPKDRIIEWYNDYLENSVDGTKPTLNYSHWLELNGYISYQSKNPHQEANFKINIAL